MKTNIFKNKFSTVLVLLLIVAFGMLPLSAGAVSILPPFGGFVNYVIPCTCNGMLWIYFTPLYLTPIPMTGPLTYSPYGSQLYEGYLIGVPSTWELGDFNPTGAAACLILTPLGCVPLPSLGLMNQVGTSVY